MFEELRYSLAYRVHSCVNPLNRTAVASWKDRSPGSLIRRSGRKQTTAGIAFDRPHRVGHSVADRDVAADCGGASGALEAESARKGDGAGALPLGHVEEVDADRRLLEPDLVRSGSERCCFLQGQHVWCTCGIKADCSGHRRIPLKESRVQVDASMKLCNHTWMQ